MHFLTWETITTCTRKFVQDSNSLLPVTHWLSMPMPMSGHRARGLYLTATF